MTFVAAAAMGFASLNRTYELAFCAFSIAFQIFSGVAGI
jgi:hypothetical protein